MLRPNWHGGYWDHLTHRSKGAHGSESVAKGGITVSRVIRVGASRVSIIFGDITKSRCQVLVSSDDYRLSMGGGVSAALLRAGGKAISEHARKVGPQKLGEVVVTAAGKLPARYVLHAITIGPNGVPQVPTKVIVRSATRRVMELLPLLGCGSVAFPAIGTGVAGLSYEEVASEMASALVESLLSVPDSYDVEIYISRVSWSRTSPQPRVARD